MWTIFTEAQINNVARQLFLPLVLLINYTLLQYLLFFYWNRRREPRMVLLFIVGAIGVVCLIPLANDDLAIVQGLNDASETCCVVTFLIQITVIGNDLNSKFRIKSVLYLTRAAEVLIAADVGMIVISLLATFSPGSISESTKNDIPNAFESLTLLFIFFFRFYYIAMSRGWRAIVATRKVELLWYVLFTTHEMPFILLTEVSGLPWEFPQGIYMRITLAGCLFITANAKAKSASKKYNTSIQSVRNGDRSSVNGGRISVRGDRTSVGGAGDRGGSVSHTKRASLASHTIQLQTARRLSMIAAVATTTTTEPRIVE